MFARSLVPRLRVSLKSRHPLVAQFRYEHSTTKHLPPKRGFRIRTTLHPPHHEEPHRNATTTTATTPLRTIPDGSEENSFCSGAGCRLDWTDTPKTILLVQKPNDKAAETALIAVARFLKTKWKYLNIIIESRIGYLAEEIPFAHIVTEDDKSELTRTVDFVVAIGGDGTMLRVSSLFETVVPPIISFSMGTLGFLMPFDRKSYQEALMRMMKSDLSVLLRTRLACSLRTRYGKKILRDGRGTDGIHVVNEVVLHRGQTPHLARVDVFVDEQFLTDAVGDGLIVATPTGSTAYSLSAGGPIVHPSVSCLILTPICPQSLSFRPALLPGYSKIQLRMSQASRTPAQISFDGSQIGLLDAGEYLQVETSPYSVPCVNRVEEGTDWVRDVNDMLKWNQTFGGGGRGDGT